MTISEQWLVDLDGVVWLGTEPISGSAKALDQLRESGRKIAFFTNNSFSTRQQLLDKFEQFSVKCAPDELLSSAQAAALLCNEGERALVVGGNGIVEALGEVGVEAITPSDYGPDTHIDVVVVGFDPRFDFSRMTAAHHALRGGARLIGTNDDATYPMPEGPVPGGGSMLAAVSYASGMKPTVAGKPNDGALALIAKRIGKVDVAVGDRPSTDGVLAERLGAKFAYVRSGVKEPLSLSPQVQVALEGADLKELVDKLVR
jgi:HAD superfamily hydrolase (TIGR01450 family)